MGRLERLTKAVQWHDRELFAQRMTHGRIGIFRQSYRFEHYDFDGMNIIFTKDSPHLIFTLTHNWTANGRPVEWGIEPILARLKAIDLWQNESQVEDMIKGYEKDKESTDRDRDNSIESFLLDFRRQFQKTFNQFNVSGMKTDNRSKRDGHNKSNLRSE